MDVPIVDRVVAGGDRVAVVDPGGTSTFSRARCRRAHGLAATLRDGHADLADARVAVLAEAGREFVVAVLGCWHAGAVVVPLHPPHPQAELDYVVNDADASAIVTSSRHRRIAEQLAGALDCASSSSAPPMGRRRAATEPATLAAQRPALMLHTSGTTGRPKGVVHTHGSIAAQVDALLEAWAWSDRDRILLVLPLNHVHGLVNVTLCALAAGALLRSAWRLRRRVDVVPLGVGRADAVHGGTDDLRPADRRLGRR